MHRGVWFIHHVDVERRSGDELLHQTHLRDDGAHAHGGERDDDGACLVQAHRHNLRRDVP